MRKKYKLFTLTGIIGIIMSIFLLVGCAGKGNGREDAKEIPITELIDLSPSNILNIKISQGGGPQTVIENPDQIEEICSFLSSAFTLENQYTDFSPPMVDGGLGDYFLIRYSDESTTHMQIGKEEATGIAAVILIKGRIRDGEIQDKWRDYPLVNFSQQDRLKEILSMNPIS